MESDVVGDFSLCEKYARQIGSFAQVRTKIKDVTPLSDCIETIFLDVISIKLCTAVYTEI